MLQEGQYKSAAPTLSNGDVFAFRLDQLANLLVSMGTTLAGEDVTNGVMKVEEQFASTNITTNTTTVVKSGSGLIKQFTINNPGKITIADLVVTVYDNTAASGTKIGTWTIPVSATTQVLPPISLNVKFSTGLTIVTSGPTVPADITVSYR